MGDILIKYGIHVTCHEVESAAPSGFYPRLAFRDCSAVCVKRLQVLNDFFKQCTTAVLSLLLP